MEKTYQIGDFACLEVVDVNHIGAFLDWGQEKDLFLPFSEQTSELAVGEYVVVHIYLDKAERPCSTMKINKLFKADSSQYKLGDEVDLIIFAKTDLGYKAIINNSHQGVLFKEEVFEKIYYGQELKGFIKNIRPDGKIDLSLTKTGYKAVGDIETKILDYLKNNNGILNFNEKTDPEEIYSLFGVSKKKYKMAIGALYKKRLIVIEDSCLRLCGL